MAQLASPVFKNATLQQEFDERGYVRIKILNSEEVAHLLHEYQSLPRPRESGFHCTMFSPSKEVKQRTSSMIKNALDGKISPLLNNYEALYGNFMVKEPGVESDWFVHQDWTYVDEPASESIAAWIPLTDLTEENGVLCMVPGSHKIMNTVRGPGIADPWQSLHEAIKAEFHEPVYLKAGEMIVWNHRTVHFSPPNLSETERVAATLIYTPADLPVIHFWKDPKDASSYADTYIVNELFYSDYNIVDAPKNQPCKAKADSWFPMITKDQLLSVYERASSSSFAQHNSTSQ